MDAERYLARIGYEGSRDPSPATLAALQRAHMTSVPFENLDISLGRPLVLDRAANYRKIVERRRGGWCYELNGMFSWLLAELGFDVTLLGSAVAGPGGASRDLAHLLLRVDLDVPYIADVGFGESSLRPLPLADVSGGVIQNENELQVRFTLEPRKLEDFEEMSRWQQTSPESGFVRRRKITLAQPDGRITIRDLTFTEWRGSDESVRELSGDDEWRAVLAECFGVDLGVS
ncbi:MAG: N-hydroxyarylamine O-acetyltransferase [Gaiellales bacterium]|nr:N-hydroxyarylamine O-acetyltransferase [Gaiellales bacterium]